MTACASLLRLCVCYNIPVCHSTVSVQWTCVHGTYPVVMGAGGPKARHGVLGAARPSWAHQSKSSPMLTPALHPERLAAQTPRPSSSPSPSPSPRPLPSPPPLLSSAAPPRPAPPAARRRLGAPATADTPPSRRPLEPRAGRPGRLRARHARHALSCPRPDRPRRPQLPLFA